jgi:predicted ester cyclase
MKWEDSMTTTTCADPETVVRRLIDEGFTGGRLEVADELIADDLVEHQSFGPDHAPGAEGVRAVIGSLKRAFPDFRLEIEDLVVAGDIVWTRNVATGTNHGSFLGNPPTGERIRIDVFDVLRVVDGRVVEHWGVPDRLGVLFQLGLAQPPGSRAA